MQHVLKPSLRPSSKTSQLFVRLVIVLTPFCCSELIRRRFGCNALNVVHKRFMIDMAFSEIPVAGGPVSRLCRCKWQDSFHFFTLFLSPARTAFGPFRPFLTTTEAWGGMFDTEQ
ncbi:hypothetical protein AVEN_259194-1 [Araneus ventricosus]|uniref:Uncharacterized protein n=1 Tax=Araneus ventricosus TaxID=182803 RepID=A0A4Y2WEX0_ARAVE|nr:hypothetical protein AVEN_259194-1 [Araneus ventricosus]